jgi:hypothetical protein
VGVLERIIPEVVNEIHDLRVWCIIPARMCFERILNMLERRNSKQNFSLLGAKKGFCQHCDYCIKNSA